MRGVRETTDASIMVQVLCGLWGAQGLLYKDVPRDAKMLQTLLGLETGVQVVELLFYVLFLRTRAVEDMARVRYYDWVLTTPVMLFTTMAYLSKTKTLREFYEAHREAVQFVLTMNALMLAAGYAGEVGLTDRITATVVGSVAFGLGFRRMFTEFGSSPFLAWMTGLWGLYGVAYLLPDEPKNTTLNTLDVFAKNFFGVFLFRELQARIAQGT